MSLALLVTGITILLLPSVATAQDPGSIINTVAGGSVAYGDFGSLAAAIGNAFKILVYGISVLVIARAGIYLSIEQGDEQIAKSRRSIIGALAAIVIANLAERLAAIMTDGGGIVTNPSGVASGLSNEIIGFVNFIEVPIAVMAVLMIIITGIKAAATFGTDQAIPNLRRAILAIFAGILLVILKAAIVNAVVIEKSPTGLFDDVIVSVIAKILGFVTLLAVAVLVYAGLLMIVNIGNDDQYNRAKGIVVRVIIGLLVITLSVTIASVVIAF